MYRYKIAGITVDIDIKYDRLKKQGKPYQIPSDSLPADISLHLEEKVYIKARKRFPNLSDENLEYLLYGFMFYDKLLDFGGMMLHASAVAVGRYAYLFSANSGVGKSTHTKHYLELFGDKAQILNDDKPALREIDGKFYCFGTPFSGKHDISLNKGFELGGICFLSRGKENKIQKIDTNEAFKLIYPQTQSMDQSERIEKRLDILDHLLKTADLYKMECIDDISAAQVSFSVMKKSIPVKLEEIKELFEGQLKSGKAVKFKTKGDSMYPLLIDGRDSVTLKSKNKIRKNDVVLFKNTTGEYVLHRVKKIDNGFVYARGDALVSLDEPVKKENVIATAISFERNRKVIKSNNLLYKLYSFIYTSNFGLKLRIIKNKGFRK